MKNSILTIVILTSISLNAQVLNYPKISIPFQSDHLKNEVRFTVQEIKEQQIQELLYVLEITKDSTLINNIIVDSIVFGFNTKGQLEYSRSKTRSVRLYYNDLEQLDSAIEIFSYTQIPEYTQTYRFIETDTGTIYQFTGKDIKNTYWLNEHQTVLRNEHINRQDREVYTYKFNSHEAARVVFLNEKKRFEVKSRWVVENGQPVRFHSFKKTYEHMPNKSPDYSGYFEVDSTGKAILPRAYLSLCSNFYGCRNIKMERTQLQNEYQFPRSTFWYFWNHTFDPNHVEFRKESLFVKKGGNWQKIQRM